MTETKTFFAYLNIEHPLVAWEVAIGRVQSVGEINDSGFGVSLWEYSRLQDYARQKNLQRFRNELRLEQLRRRKYRDKVSRLQGLYFFETESDAHDALERWGLGARRQYISRVTFFPLNLTEHDSEWITSNLASDNDPGWMDDYWSGATAGIKPLKEILGLGTGLIENKDIRIRAYKRIIDLWPTATPLLAAASCAFAAGLRDVAVVKPGLLSKMGKIIGGYYIYMAQFDARQPEVIAAVKECKKRGEFPPVILPSDQTKDFTIPDLRSYSFEIESAELAREFTAASNAT